MMNFEKAASSKSCVDENGTFGRFGINSGVLCELVVLLEVPDPHSLFCMYQILRSFLLPLKIEMLFVFFFFLVPQNTVLQ